MRRLNNLKKFEQILLVGWILILTACQSLPQCPEMPIAPAKPNLPSLIQTPVGGMILNREDTQALAEYILELEQGYK